MNLKIKLKQIYFEYLESVLEAINEMLSEYPVSSDLVKVIHIRKLKREYEHSFATAKDVGIYNLKYEIKLNKTAFTMPEIQKRLNSTSGAYYYSIKSIIYHEFGHCLQLFMPFEQMGISLKKYTYRYIQNHFIVTMKMIKDEYIRYFHNFFMLFNWNYDDVCKYLGVYAAENPMELLPECFNLYYSLRNIESRNESDEKRYQFSKAVIEDYKEHYL